MKLLRHSVIVLHMDGIIVKTDYSLFTGDLLAPPHKPMGSLNPTLTNSLTVRLVISICHNLLHFTY